MKKTLLMTFAMTLLMTFMLIGTVNALDFDNKIIYSEEDLKIELKNWCIPFTTLCLGTNYGSAELKSHPSINYVKEVGAGKQVVMFYDFNFKEIYKNGLGDVEFTDVKTGKKILRDYEFVYWGIKEYEVPKYSCNPITHLNGTTTKGCIQKGTETKEKETWLPYDSKDIPLKEIRIGIKVDVLIDDYVDGVWTIGGKKVKKHAEWTNLLNAGLVAYYDFDEGTGTSAGDSVHGHNLTGNNTPTWTTSGIIGNAGVLKSASLQCFYNTTTGSNLYPDLPFTINIWYNSTVSGESANRDTIISKDSSTGDNRRYAIRVEDSLGFYTRIDDAGGNPIQTYPPSVELIANKWNMYTLVADGTNTLFYINGTFISSVGTLSDLHNVAEQPFYIGREVSGNWVDGAVDEVAIWNRTITPTEITQLWNGGSGIQFLPNATADFVPDVTDHYPLNTTNFSVQTITTNATIWDDYNITKVEWYVNGVLNQTNQTQGLYNNTIFTFSATLPEGTHTIQFNATDNATTPQSTLGNLTFITIDTKPRINATHPTNTSYTITTLWFNATSDVDIDFWWINYNGTNVTIKDQAGQLLNKSLTVEDGNHHLLIYGNNSESNTIGLNNTIHFTVDATAPTQEFIFPKNNTNTTTIILPTSLIMNVSVSDLHLDLCLWSNDSYVTNHTYTCNKNETINFGSEGRYTIYQCVNDTLGFQTCGSRSNWIHHYNFTSGATPTKVTEGSSVAFTLFVNRTNIESTIAILEVNKTNYTSPLRTEEPDYTKFTQSVIIPNGWGNATGTTVLSKWYFNISTIVQNVTSAINLNITSVELDDCSTYGKRILNYTLLDEETKGYTHLGQLIEIDVNLISPFNDSISWNYSSEETEVNQSDVCVPTSLLENSWFRMDTTTRYLANGYVTEFNHLDNYNLSNETSHQNISLYVLNVSDSTSFLVEYQDDDYLPVQNAIIDLLRFYVGEGIYRSVEHGKTDENGQTVLHFVTEEIQYRAIVRIGNEIDYQSPDFLALCQETPCQINLQKQDDVLDITNFDTASDLIFDLLFNDTTRNITLTYATRDGSSSTVVLNLTRWDANLNNTICTETETSSAGTLVCHVPLTAKNTTYFLEVRSDDSFVTQSSFSLKPDAFENFGYTGIILVGLLFLTLVLIAIPSGAIATLVFGVIGLIFAGMLTIFNSGSILGVGSAMMWLIIAIIIIIIKISGRQRHR